MADFTNKTYFQPAEELAKYLSEQTQSDSLSFFRTIVDYNFCKIAASMRIKVNTHDKGLIPINMYAIALAPSGTGKGHSTNLMEDIILKGFTDRFTNELLPIVTAEKLADLAAKKAKKKGTDPDDELLITEAEFDRAGNFLMSFDSGTTPAIKQLRHKLLMCGAGSLNMEIDEIGSNLLTNQEVLATFLELFDVGKVKQKLTKNTNENIRGEDIQGRTPTNLLLFGTPTKLLNGSKTEEEYTAMLLTGYGRRCFFSYTPTVNKTKNLSPKEAYLKATNKTSVQNILNMSAHLELLADYVHFDKQLEMSEEVAIHLIAYKMHCEERAEAFAEHQDIEKAEMSHRFFKTIKLAGAYAYVEGLSYEVKMHHLDAAITRSEESGEDFQKMQNRDRNYVKLAKYIVNTKHEVTNVDLVEDLPFYKGSVSQKNDLITLAVDWAYKHNMIIKQHFNNGIAFFKGETLETTELSKLILSHSSDWTTGYKPELAPFEQLDKLFQLPAHNWLNHHMLDGYREEDKAIAGFNLVILDVDEGTTIKETQTFLQDYKYYIYTTKRHQKEGNGDRFRIVLPISHVLNLSKDEYKLFMQNIANFLPIKVDTKTFQRAKKWFTHNGFIYCNDEGDLLNALLFIPKTSKSEQLRTNLNDLDSLNNLERWFVYKTGTGNRNDQLLKYALMLVDAGKSFEQVEMAVKQLNEKLPNSLNEAEIASTIMSTTAKAIAKRG